MNLTVQRLVETHHWLQELKVNYLSAIRGVEVEDAQSFIIDIDLRCEALRDSIKDLLNTQKKDIIKQ
jgi:hypothetical protein